MDSQLDHIIMQKNDKNETIDKRAAVASWWRSIAWYLLVTKSLYMT